METTGRYMITASGYPPYSSMAYRGQRLLCAERSLCPFPVPVRWVADDGDGMGLSGEEARERLSRRKAGPLLYEIAPLDAVTDVRDPGTRTRWSKRPADRPEFVVPTVPDSRPAPRERRRPDPSRLEGVTQLSEWLGEDYYAVYRHRDELAPAVVERPASSPAVYDGPAARVIWDRIQEREREERRVRAAKAAALVAARESKPKGKAVRRSLRAAADPGGMGVSALAATLRVSRETLTVARLGKEARP